MCAEERRVCGLEDYKHYSPSAWAGARNGRGERTSRHGCALERIFRPPVAIVRVPRVMDVRCDTRQKIILWVSERIRTEAEHKRCECDHLPAGRTSHGVHRQHARAKHDLFHEWTLYIPPPRVKNNQSLIGNSTYPDVVAEPNLGPEHLKEVVIAHLLDCPGKVPAR